MGFENASITWGAKQLAAMVKNERIVFGNIIQRSYVWEKTRKSLFIHSLAIGVPIPPTYAKRFDDGSGKRNSNVYDMLDGKQRFSTVAEFINNELVLTELPPVTFYNELTDEQETEDISNKTFEELSEGLQEKIKNARISVVYFDNLTKEEERELFKRLNNGKPLSTKSRVLASCRDIEGLLDIGSHELFAEMLTEKALDNKNQVGIVMKIWCMMNQDIADVSFESKNFNPLMETTEISEEDRLEMVQVFDLIMNTHTVLMERKEKKVAKKLYTETHLVSLVPYFAQAISDGIDEERMSDWLVEFFKPIDGDTSVSEDYNNASGSGSAKSVNIQLRNSALADSFAEFFKVDGNEDSETLIPSEEDVQEDTETEDSTASMEEELENTSNFVDSIIEDMKNAGSDSENE